MRSVPPIGRSRDLVWGIVFAGLLLGTSASAAVIAVPADQPTIQAAVDAAGAGDVISVSPGVYPERVRITGARDGLTIEAADPADRPIVQGDATRSTDGIQVEGVDDVVLRALRIVDANTGVRLTRTANALLEDLRLENDGLAVRLADASGTTVRRAVIEGTRGRQGFLVESSPSTTIEDSAVHSPKREGIAIRNSDGATVLRTTVDGSRGSDGVLVYRSRGCRIEDVTTTNNARNGLRAQSSLDLALVRTTANDNGGAGIRLERSSPFDEVSDVLAAGNTATGNDGRDIIVQPFRCNQTQCPPTTTFTTSTTSSTTSTTSTTVVGPPTTTTTSTTIAPPPLADASWRFYVRISTGASPRNVDVPAHSTDAALAVQILADHLPAFSKGDQVTGAEIAALGGDTLNRLVSAAAGYIAAHPADYPGFGAVIELRWAKRVGP